MGRPIGQVVCKMAVAVPFDATLRAHVFDETKRKITVAASSQFGFEKISVHNSKFSKNIIRRS
jgi:hypothetical protein